MTLSHALGGRLPLLSTRPTVTFPAEEHHCPSAGTKLYCFVTEAHGCEQLAQGCYPIAPRRGIDLTTSEFSRCGDTIQCTNLKHFSWQLELPSLLRLYRFMSVSLSVDTVVILSHVHIEACYKVAPCDFVSTPVQTAVHTGAIW